MLWVWLVAMRWVFVEWVVVCGHATHSIGYYVLPQPIAEGYTQTPAHAHTQAREGPAEDALLSIFTVAERTHIHIHSEPSGVQLPSLACFSHLLAFLVQSCPRNT